MGQGIRSSLAWIACAVLLGGGMLRGADCEPDWRLVTAPPVGDDGNATLGPLAVISKDDIWSVGNYVDGPRRRSLIEHWDGKAWSVTPSVDGARNITFLTGISAVATGDVWVVGYSMDAIVGTSKSETLIQHWDGKTWTRVPSPNLTADDVGPEFGGFDVSNELYSVTAVSKDDVWAVGRSYTFSIGQELIVHWDGKQWGVSPSPHPPESAWLRGVVHVTSTDVWALGEYYAEVPDGGEGAGGAGTIQQNLIEHWNGAEWSVVPSPNVPPAVNGIYRASVISKDDIWAIGYHLAIFGVDQVQQPTVLHWDGGEWAIIPSSLALNEENAYFFSVAAVDPQHVYFGGFYDTGGLLPHFDTLVFQYDGLSWLQMQTLNPARNHYLYGMAAVGSDDLWVVGEAFLEEFPYGTLIEHFSGDCPAAPTFVRGNVNGDGSVDITDAVSALSYLFQGGQAPPCLDALDVDDNGTLQITDPIYLLAFLFQGGPAPPLPFPDAGPDPSDDALECAGSP